MPNAYISGVAMNIPDNVVTNDDLREKYGIDTTHEWVVQRTGIEARCYAPDGVGPDELAVPAAQKAIERAGLKPWDIDMILFATLSPKWHFPGSGVLLQRRLGLCEGENARFVPAMDLRNQCSGFIYGLATASSMVQSGGCKHVLVVGSEVHSAGMDFTTRGRTVTTLFGDAAGAAVVSATDEDRGMRGWWLGADGRYADALKMEVFDFAKRPFVALESKDGDGRISPEVLWPQMEGKVVFKHAVERMGQVITNACKEKNIAIGDIDLFLFHQANMRINQYVANQLGIPDSKLIHNIHKYGNTTAATIPTLMAEAVETGRLKPGMKVAMVAFGAGFTWGAALMDW